MCNLFKSVPFISVLTLRLPLSSLTTSFLEFHVLLTVHPCIISQINPTRCTILFNIFIYLSSLHVSGIHVPIIRRKLLYPCVTGTCNIVWVASGLLLGVKLQPADQTPPIQCDKYQLCMGTVIFSWWWAHGCPKHVEKKNKYIEQNCAPSWIYLRDHSLYAAYYHYFVSPFCITSLRLAVMTSLNSIGHSDLLHSWPHSIFILLHYFFTLLLIVPSSLCNSSLHSVVLILRCPSVLSAITHSSILLSYHFSTPSLTSLFSHYFTVSLSHSL